MKRHIIIADDGPEQNPDSEIIRLILAAGH